MPDQPPALIQIMHTQLSPEALRAVVESFVLREGTEYGEREFSLDEKVAQILRQLERDEAQIVFDPQTQSVNIVTGAAGRGRRR